jgi:hypothetical protein
MRNVIFWLVASGPFDGRGFVCSYRRQVLPNEQSCMTGERTAHLKKKISTCLAVHGVILMPGRMHCQNKYQDSFYQ